MGGSVKSTCCTVAADRVCKGTDVDVKAHQDDEKPHYAYCRVSMHHRLDGSDSSQAAALR